MKLHRCPICHAIGVIHLGTPPSEILYNYHNRCVGKALTGEPGVGIFDTGWKAPRVNPRVLCGFRMTTESGEEIVDPLSAQEYIAFTSKPFRVDDLVRLVLSFSI